MQKELVQILVEMVESRSDSIPGYEYLIMWHEVFSELSLLLGPYMTYALFVRSLEINRHDFPWLLPIHQFTNGTDIFAGFEETVLVQLPQDVNSITRALLATYIDLLYSIIGSTLTIQVICRIASKKTPRT